jgi:hypothetical protein
MFSGGILRTEFEFGTRNDRRQSQRVCVCIDVVVLWRDAEGEPISEETKTLVVNAHGALLSLSTAVRVGDSIHLKNVTTQEEIACRVRNLGASDKKTGIRTVAIEFVEPSAQFWHISFPPADWSFHSPDAKTHGR